MQLKRAEIEPAAEMHDLQLQRQRGQPNDRPDPEAGAKCVAQRDAEIAPRLAVDQPGHDGGREQHVHHGEEFIHKSHAGRYRRPAIQIACHFDQRPKTEAACGDEQEEDQDLPAGAQAKRTDERSMDQISTGWQGLEGLRIERLSVGICVSHRSKCSAAEGRSSYRRTRGREVQLRCRCRRPVAGMEVRVGHVPSANC